MYNLSSILKSIVDKLDINKCNELAAVKTDASGMISLNTSGAWDNTRQAESKGKGMDSIPEEPERRGSEPEDPDDLGVFDDDDVREALNQMNYQVAYVAYGVCLPSIA
jgi:hypothetical protein